MAIVYGHVENWVNISAGNHIHVCTHSGFISPTHTRAHTRLSMKTVGGSVKYTDESSRMHIHDSWFLVPVSFLTLVTRVRAYAQIHTYRIHTDRCQLLNYLYKTHTPLSISELTCNLKRLEGKIIGMVQQYNILEYAMFLSSAYKLSTNISLYSMSTKAVPGQWSYNLEICFRPWIGIISTRN